MTVASRYGSMMLSRAAARQPFAAPLAIRTFSSSLARYDQNSRGDSKDRPVRTNPLVGNYTPAQPAQPKSEETPPTSTEKPQSSQPPSPEKTPTSSAEVPPNADMPPPPPPAAAAESSKAPKGKQSGHAYDAASSDSSSYLNLDKLVSSDPTGIIDRFHQNYAASVSVVKDPTKQPRVRTAPVTGRTVFLNTGAGWQPGQANNPDHAFNMLRNVLNESKVSLLAHRQRFHERPGLKRKRLKMERWRKRFKTGFKATTQRVNELKRQGW